jgi:hypothetical protein
MGSDDTECASKCAQPARRLDDQDLIRFEQGVAFSLSKLSNPTLHCKLCEDNGRDEAFSHLRSSSEDTGGVC